MTIDIEYQCNNCGHEGLNTRAEPNVSELVRYRLNSLGELVYSEKGQYVLHSQAAAIIAAKDAFAHELSRQLRSLEEALITQKEIIDNLTGNGK